MSEEQVGKIVKEGRERTEEILESIEARRGIRWAQMASDGAQNLHTMSQLAAIVKLESSEPVIHQAIDDMLRSIWSNMLKTQTRVASGNLDTNPSKEIQKDFIADIDIIMQAVRSCTTKLVKAL